VPNHVSRPVTDRDAGTPLMDRLNTVRPMTAAEEASLCEAHEDARFAMLESVLSIPLGRRLFHEPFQRLLDGEAMETCIVDPAHWGLRQQRLPRHRVEEMRGLLALMNRTYQDRATVRKLHLSWPWVEQIGKLTFSGLDASRKLVKRRKELLDGLGTDFENLQDRAVRHVAPPLPEVPGGPGALVCLPELTSIRMELDLTEVRSGVDIPRYVAAALRWREATERLGDVIERFVESNLRLVVSRVRGYYTGNAMDEMDLVQEGCQGLIQAVGRFDHSRGFRFSTYAVWWIKQTVLKAIMRQSRLVRIPAGILMENARIRAIMDALTAEAGRPPTTAELAEHLEMDLAELEDILGVTDPLLSLDHTTGEQDSTIADFLAASIDAPEQETILRERKDLLREAMATLTDREKTVVTLRFGLLDGRACSLAEVGELFGVSRERVRQIELHAVRKLRRHCVPGEGVAEVVE